METRFIHLSVHSNYSLLSGASRIEDLLNRARELGFDALALTDTNGLYGAIPFMQKAREFGIKPIVGAEVDGGPSTVACPGERFFTSSAVRRIQNDMASVVRSTECAVCLVRNREGYTNLCRIITARRLDKNFCLADALVQHQDGLFILARSPFLLQQLAGKIATGSLFREVRNEGSGVRGQGSGVRCRVSGVRRQFAAARPSGGDERCPLCVAKAIRNSSCPHGDPQEQIALTGSAGRIGAPRGVAQKRERDDPVVFRRPDRA